MQQYHLIDGQSADVNTEPCKRRSSHRRDDGIALKAFRQCTQPGVAKHDRPSLGPGLMGCQYRGEEYRRPYSVDERRSIQSAAAGSRLGRIHQRGMTLCLIFLHRRYD